MDYDNARPDANVTERTAALFEQNLGHVFQALLGVVGAIDPEVSELRVRLYGGWVYEDGRWTERAEWAREALRGIRGRRHGMRIIPEVVTALIRAPGMSLRGTARVRRDRRGYTLQQKMVDSMLAVDLANLAVAPDEIVVVVSDDDDLVPSMIAAGRRIQGLHLIRHRIPGHGCNDHHLEALRVTIQVLGTRP